MLAPDCTSDRVNILLSSTAVWQDNNVSLGPVAIPCWIHQDGSNAIMDSPVPPFKKLKLSNIGARTVFRW